jgi:hypothetical protein
MKIMEQVGVICILEFHICGRGGSLCPPVSTGQSQGIAHCPYTNIVLRLFNLAEAFLEIVDGFYRGGVYFIEDRKVEARPVTDE